MTFRIVYSDHLFDNLDYERGLFEEIDAIVVDGEATEAPLEELVADADALVVMYHPVNAALMDRMPNCRIINRSGIGFDIVDLDAATERGIYVTNIPDYCIQEVSDHAMAMILALQRKVAFYNAKMKAGRWDLNEGWMMHRIENQTLGLVAFGNIARAVCKKALAFGMNVIAYDPYLTDEQIIEGGAEPIKDIDALFMNSDVISIHTPLTPETRGLIGEREISLMKENAIKTQDMSMIKQENFMREIKRSDVNEVWAHSGIVEAGDFVFVNYCVGNVGKSLEHQINGALDTLCKRLESVVKVDCLFRDIWNVPVMESE